MTKCQCKQLRIEVKRGHWLSWNDPAPISYNGWMWAIFDAETNRLLHSEGSVAMSKSGATYEAKRYVGYMRKYGANDVVHRELI